jgi:hypothetical protein
MTNSSVKVMRSLSTQKDNQKYENQDPNRLKWQLKASNDPLSNSNKTNSFMVYHQNIRGLLNKTVELISFLSPYFPRYTFVSKTTRYTLFLNNLFQLNYPRHVSNK